MNVAMMATLMSASNSKFELAVHVTKNRPRAPCRMAVQPQPGLQGWGPVGDRGKKTGVVNRVCRWLPPKFCHGPNFKFSSNPVFLSHRPQYTPNTHIAPD